MGKGSTPAPEPAQANVEQQDLATNQQAQPVPYFAGTQIVAARWITPALNQTTKDAPMKRPGKK